jgi:hypothetical protein
LALTLDFPDSSGDSHAIPSITASRPSRDLIVAAHQQITHDWWDTRRGDFELCASELVFQEAGGGDPQAAHERLEVLKDMVLLETRQEALELAQELVRTGALPAKAFEDALHIAIAADQKIPYLFGTWRTQPCGR